jgi:hypothetical protein
MGSTISDVQTICVRLGSSSLAQIHGAHSPTACLSDRKVCAGGGGGRRQGQQEGPLARGGGGGAGRPPRRQGQQEGRHNE